MNKIDFKTSSQQSSVKFTSYVQSIYVLCKELTIKLKVPYLSVAI